MNKAQVNYWVDIATGLAFGLSAVTGLVLLLPASAAGAHLEILGVGYRLWNDVHTWSSVTMVAGALVHLALHWRWVVAMTKKALRSPATGQAAAASGGGSLSRRRVLQLGGLALASGAALVGYKTLVGAQQTSPLANDPETGLPQQGGAGFPTGAAPTAGQSAAGQPPASSTCVACPHNISYDPYPGRCRLYIDQDGDRYCDYSIPGSCSNTGLPGGGSTTPGNRRNRSLGSSRSF